MFKEIKKIEALQDARKERENCINDPYFGAMQSELKTISELLFTLYQGQPLIGGQFADFCQLTKEPEPLTSEDVDKTLEKVNQIIEELPALRKLLDDTIKATAEYEPTEKELWELDKEASEERANNMNLFYEGYTDQQHF